MLTNDMSESNELLDYGHLTPGRPCLFPERLTRVPAFNVGRPLPHFDGPAYIIATALALRIFLPRAAAAIFEAAAVALAACLRA